MSGLHGSPFDVNQPDHLCQQPTTGSPTEVRGAPVTVKTNTLLRGLLKRYSLPDIEREV
jgi:hypothetical protein